MSIFKNKFSERELKHLAPANTNRFLRPDWRRFWRGGHENNPLYRLSQRIERKYSSDQPRDGFGRWTSEDAGSRSESTKPRQWISSSTEESCLAQYRKDKFVCSAFSSPACYAQAMLRYSNCLAGRPIPPLNF